MAVVYLSPSGSDSYTYVQAQSSATPWQTLAKVGASASSGDTVEMAAGTYTWASITWSKNFTFNGPTITGLLPTAIVDAASTAPMWLQNANVVLTFNRVKFTGIYRTTVGYYSTTWGGNNGASPLPTLYLNTCVFSDCTDYFSGGQYGILGSYYHRFNVYMTNCLVYNIKNYINSTSCGFFGDIDYANNTNMVKSLTNCIFYFNKTGTEGVYGLFYANTNATTGFTLTVKNSIIYNGTGGTCYIRTTTSIPVTMTYTDTYSMTNVPSGTGNITSDPLLVDAANGIFKLRPTSPCRGTGTAV